MLRNYVGQGDFDSTTIKLLQVEDNPRLFSFIPEIWDARGRVPTEGYHLHWKIAQDHTAFTATKPLRTIWAEVYLIWSTYSQLNLGLGREKGLRALCRGPGFPDFPERSFQDEV